MRLCEMFVEELLRPAEDIPAVHTFLINTVQGQTTPLKRSQQRQVSSHYPVGFFIFHTYVM